MRCVGDDCDVEGVVGDSRELCALVAMMLLAILVAIHVAAVRAQPTVATLHQKPARRLTEPAPWRPGAPPFPFASRTGDRTGIELAIELA